MKKYYLLTLLLLPLFAIAQSHYKNGYVVTVKGDTLGGYIDLKEWGHNPKDISFRTSLASKPQQLGLADINYFEIIDYARYRQYTVSVSLNQVDISFPASPSDTTREIRGVFLQILQTGKNVTLYAYRDDLKERFYIKDNNMATPIELAFGIYQSEISGNVVMKTSYRLQLSQYVMKYNSGSGRLNTEVQQAAYNESDLRKVVAKINGDTREPVSMGRAGSTAARFFAGPAFISNTIKAGQYYSAPSSTSNSLKITAGADLIINPAAGHLVFRIELAYSTNNYTFNDISDPIYNIANPQINVVMVKQNVISIAPQAIYNIYSSNGLKVFVDVGGCMNILSYPPNKITQSGGNLTTGTHIMFDSKSNYATIQFKGGGHNHEKI